MNDVRKKILLDLFVTPMTVIPFIGGMSLLMLSSVLGGFCAFIGFMGLLGSFGMAATNFFFNMKGISENAAKEWHKKQSTQRELELDALDKRLKKTKGQQDEQALRNLRTLYRSFCSDVQAGKINNSVPKTMLGQIDEIFDACIKQLERGADLHKTSSQVSGNLKKELLSQFAGIVKEVEESVEGLALTMIEVRKMGLKTQKSEMSQLQRKLASQLSVAQAVEERVSALSLDTSVEEQYSEYLTE